MAQIEKKLNAIENETSELKMIVLKQNLPKQKISLKGLLKGVSINENTIEASKKSLFKIVR